MDDSAIMCDEVTESYGKETKTIPTNFNGKKAICKMQNYYFFDDIINIKFFDPNDREIDEKSYKSIVIYYIGYVTIKDLK